MEHVLALLRNLEIVVEVVTSTEAALVQLEQGQFDLIASDMRRGGVADAGLQLLAEVRRRNIALPVILTASAYDPARGTPPYAFGMTNRVDEFLNLVFDALERVRG